MTHLPFGAARDHCHVAKWCVLFTVVIASGAAAAETDRSSFTNPFGLQLRPVPATMAAIHAPVILRSAPTNETCLLRRGDGTLELYGIVKPASDAVAVMRSADGGLSWSEPAIAFPLPGKAYYALQVLEATNGALHAVVHLLGEGPGGYRGRLYEVHHVSRERAAATWSAPRRIVPGYVGSIRGFTQLHHGRLVLAVARAIPEREKPPAAGPDRGWNDTFVYFSDDAGASWRESPDVLSLVLATPNMTRYGAIEPVLLELRDRVWMLVRDRGGRLWESHSPDGERWPSLRRTAFISSDSPAGLLRLRDGRIVLFLNACQNWSDPRSYAMGGREVLHAAISADDGASWQGFREVLHETLGAGRGDRGTAYPSAAENTAGKVVVASGQGDGKRALFAFDPAWLAASDAMDDLSAGPVGWTQYGSAGLTVVSGEGATRALAIPSSPAGYGGALWNFPSAVAGEIRLRIRVQPGVTALQFCLNDHFNRIDDGKAAEHAVFSIPLHPWLPPDGGRWHDVRVGWANATRAGEAALEIDGKPAGRVAAQRPAQFGLNYLRVNFRGRTAPDAVWLAGMSMRLTP